MLAHHLQTNAAVDYASSLPHHHASPGLQQHHKHLNRINSFTLMSATAGSNSGLHFELSVDPTELIGAIFWQLKRIKIEKYEPVVYTSGSSGLASGSDNQ